MPSAPADLDLFNDECRPISTSPEDDALTTALKSLTIVSMSPGADSAEPLPACGGAQVGSEEVAPEARARDEDEALPLTPEAPPVDVDDAAL